MATENIDDNRRLEELDGSDYEIADGEPHVKGWHIKEHSGASIGKVHDLLFNPATRKVRYLIANLEARVFGVENREVLIPIGLAELHLTKDEVYLPAITIAQLAAAPDYIRETFKPEDETIVRDAFSDNIDIQQTWDERTFYEHDHYNERNFYGRRFTGGDGI
ncbi:PRC-barrel domain-containing protein [Pedobacter hartonius]|uniref:PRC-barrel domain-containing protein n=1 Tax=Pedobacter hartonius TaxID=425514 RepID=A0A1H4BGN4_9SPHI|nr:PRC-barrel domain-containing protein [Pedobacter hartonius]SEA47247.1 PRC-barrel domain-containing protein [Pedobacter hartonius]